MDEKEKIPQEEAKTVVSPMGNKVVETYAEDMAKVIGDDQAGLIKKIIQQEEMNLEMKNTMSPESVQNKLYMTLSFVFLALSLVILGFFLLKKEASVVVPKIQFTPIISVDNASFVDIDGLSKDQVIDKILSTIKNSFIKTGDLEGIYLSLAKEPVGIRKFSAVLGSSLDLSNDSIVSDNFLLGFTNDTTHNPFILLQVKSFQDVFPLMQSWEDKMYIDINKLFTPSQDIDLFAKDFEDGLVENKNARILYDKNGGVVLMYVYLDDNYVLITNSKDTVRNVLDRVFSSKIRQ